GSPTESSPTIGMVVSICSPVPSGTSLSPPSSVMQSSLTAAPVAGGGGNRHASHVMVGAAPPGLAQVAVIDTGSPDCTSGGSALTWSRRSPFTYAAGSKLLPHPATTSAAVMNVR